MGKDDLRVAIKLILENYQTTLEMGLWIGTPTECLIDYQSQKSFSAASISKLVLYAYYLEQIIEEKINPQQLIGVNPVDLTGGAGVIRLFPQKKGWTISELLTAMIAVSDNTATNVLLDLVGLPTLQAWIQEPEIQFERYMMRPIKDKENRLTPSAAAKLLLRCVKREEAALGFSPLNQQQFQEGLAGNFAETAYPACRILIRQAALTASNTM
jgi:beta-lactamase class A